MLIYYAQPLTLRTLYNYIFILLYHNQYLQKSYFFSLRLNHEGDGYFWFKKYGTDLKNTFTTFYSIMAEFIETHKVLSPKAKDGRLEIIH